MILLGSVSRENLLCLLNQIVGDEAQHAEYLRRMQSKSQFHEAMEDGACKDESLVNFSIASVFPKISFAEVEKHVNAEELQRSRTGSLELGVNREPKLKTYVRKNYTDISYSKKRRTGRFKSRRSDCFYLFPKPFFIKIKISEKGFNGKLASRLPPWNILEGLRQQNVNSLQRQIWEKEQLSKGIDYSYTTIDPAPFQLVEDTSLYKVHSIFSLLGIRRAYVTKCGVLVGVVAAKEIASAIERIQAGTLTAVTKRPEEDEYDKKSTTEAMFDFVESSESDTDNEDIILPRVEFDKTTSSEILEAKFAALRASIGRETSTVDRRKSYPHFPGKSCRSSRVPRYGRKSCDIILEKLSNMDDQLAKQNFGRMVEKSRRFRDSISESALSKISSRERSGSGRHFLWKLPKLLPSISKIVSWWFHVFDASQEQFSGSRSDQFIMSPDQNFDTYPKEPCSNESDPVAGTSAPQQSAAPSCFNSSLSAVHDLFIRSDPRCETGSPVNVASTATECFPEQNSSTRFVKSDADTTPVLRTKKNIA
uniref:CBS domain-containing protein n=1 Tax=Wuchereria bancrofti TaxID=6293 RepID=A0A1I8ENJ5_WUCBA